MILNKLFLLSSGHSIKRVIFTLQLSIKVSQSSCNFLFNGCSLWRGISTRSKWEAIKISTNSDSSGFDHGSFIRWEVRSVKFYFGIFSLMNVVFTMSVVNFDDWVEKCGEGIVRIVGSSINTNSRIYIFTSGEYCISKGEIILIFFFTVGLPNLTGKTLTQ